MAVFAPVLTPRCRHARARCWRQVPDISFDLGGSSAGLSADCKLQLDVWWELHFLLQYSDTAGFSIRLDTAGSAPDPLQVNAALVLQKSGCMLTGNLLFLGADIVLDHATHANVTFALTPALGQKFAFDIGLSGLAELGFAGGMKARSVQDVQNSIEAFPHFQAGWSVRWAWASNSNAPFPLAPTFDFQNPKLCIGTTLQKVAGGVVRQANKIMKPLHPLLGPDGLLLKNVPGTDTLFGRVMNVLEVGQLFCGDGCQFDNVIEAAKAISQVLGVLQTIERLADAESGSCEVSISFADGVSVDFKDAGSLRLPSGQGLGGKIGGLGGKIRGLGGKIRGLGLSVRHTGKRLGDLSFPKRPNFPTGEFNGVVGKLSTKRGRTVDGEFAVKLNFLDDPLAAFVGLLTGEDITLVTVTIPKVTVTAVATYAIPIWHIPLIEVVLELGASLTADVGEVYLLSGGLIDAVTSKDPRKMLDAVAVPALDANGAKRWQLKGSLWISGGLRVGLGPIRARATVRLELSAAMRLVDVDGDGLVRMGEVLWVYLLNGSNLLHMFEVEVTLVLSFEAKVEAFALFSWKTLLRWSHSFPPIFRISYVPKTLLPAADRAGNINIGVLADSLTTSLNSKSGESVEPKFRLMPSEGDAVTFDAITSMRYPPRSVTVIPSGAIGTCDIGLDGVSRPVVPGASPIHAPFSIELWGVSE